MNIIRENFPKSKRHQDAIYYAINQLKDYPLAPYIEAIYLYGSCARGEEKWSSDVDLCIILKESVKTVHKYSPLMHTMKGILSDDKIDSVEVDAKIFIGDEWKTSKTLFCENLRKDGKMIWQ